MWSQDHDRMTLLPSWALECVHPQKQVARVSLKVVVSPSKHCEALVKNVTLCFLKKKRKKSL